MLRLVLAILLLLLVSCAPSEDNSPVAPEQYQCQFCENDHFCYDYGIGEKIVTLIKDVEETDSTFSAFDNDGKLQTDSLSLLFPVTECLR